MRIVFIGSGNLATHLSQALKHAGQDIVQVYSRTLQNARTLAEKLECKAVASLDDVCRDADAYIFSIKDDALENVARQLREGREDAVFIHTAGSMPLSVLDTRFPSAVLYPMQTFSKTRDVAFREIPCFIEASDARVLTMVRQMAESISDNVMELASEKRRHLHLAAVFACNMVNHCYYLADRTLAEAGIDFKVMLPLIAETARKVETLSPREAQTGPMVRYDVGVMNKQIELIPDELTRSIYRIMAESIHKASS